MNRSSFVVAALFAVTLGVSGCAADGSVGPTSPSPAIPADLSALCANPADDYIVKQLTPNNAPLAPGMYYGAEVYGNVRSGNAVTLGYRRDDGLTYVPGGANIGCPGKFQTGSTVAITDSLYTFGVRGGQSHWVDVYVVFYDQNLGNSFVTLDSAPYKSPSIGRLYIQKVD